VADVHAVPADSSWHEGSPARREEPDVRRDPVSSPRPAAGVARAVPRPAALALAAGFAVAALPAAPVAAARATSTVVVMSASGARVAADAVVAAGGTVLSWVPLVDGVVAQLPQDAAPAADVVADLPLRVAGDEHPAGAASTVRATLGLDPDGSEGAGVGVALVDTGIADVADLAGRVVARVNTSGGPTGDGYGHGTFLAGLVAGSGASGAAARGVAPRAHLLDVQVADADGTTSLSRVLRGLQAVADSADRHDIRVVNLSLSSGSPLPFFVDPLARAVERLWRSGLVVVVAAGNDGPDRATITSPGTDPLVLTVGSVDDAGTASRRDDTVPVWSSRGPAPFRVAKPELVAPGSAVVSLRAPGSVIDDANPHARMGEHLFRGSGTSMSAAVASGAVAALLAERSALTPDGVKSLLTSTAYRSPGLADRDAAGRGGLDLAAALRAEVADENAERSGPERGHPLAFAPVRGEHDEWDDSDEAALDALARAWAEGGWDAAARAWADLSPAARAWAARAWAAAVVDAGGDHWSARAWAARAWAARAWAGEEWLARAWSARAWADAEWLARAWSARAWSARAWSARAWSARAWSARAWSARAWSARGWA
jgi:serine protease AprX